jgi:hypothetical protein
LNYEGINHKEWEDDENVYPVQSLEPIESGFADLQ